MGLFDKVKNLFTEEVEEPIKKEEPKKHEIKKPEFKREIRKQERKVEIAPARRESTILLEEEQEEATITEEKPILPIYFSDEDFEDLEKPKEKIEKRQERIEKKEAYQGRKEEAKKEEKKYFKPSPIISPVYGILDKNYKKDDITTRETPIVHRTEKVTVDDIRNKAYGTLEDELESNLSNEEVITKEDTGIDIFEELETRESRNSKMDLLRNDFEVEKEEPDLSVELEKQKQKIEEINEIIKNNISQDKKAVTSRKIDNILEELDEIEELIPEKEPQEEKEIIKDEDTELIDNETMNKEEENDNNKDEMEESDLFNLIDSMYEKRDE